MGTEYTINTEEEFTVTTKFWADRSLTGLSDLKYIETILSQGGAEVRMIQDCEDYLAPFTDLLNKRMAVAVSQYRVADPTDLAD